MSPSRQRPSAGESRAANARAAQPRAAAPRASGPAADSVRATHVTEAHNAALRQLVERLGAQLVVDHDIEHLLRIVADSLTTTVGVGSCDIYLLDHGGLHCLVSQGPDGYDEQHEGAYVCLEDYPATAAAIADHSPFVLATPDSAPLTAHERDELDSWGYRCELCLPLVVQGQVVGLIDLFGDEPCDFSDCHDFVRDVGNLVATTLANTLLLDQLKGANRDLRLLTTAGMEFGSSLDLESVLDSVARALCLAADAACCDIYALEDSVIRALTSVDGEVVDHGYRGTTFDACEGHMIHEILAATEPFQIPDIDRDDRVPPPERSEWKRHDLRACVALPLRAEGRVLGAAFVFDTRPRTFGNLDLLQSLARVAAQAMGNADLFRSLEIRSRENELMAEIARHTIETLSVRQMSATTIDQLRDIVGFDGAAVLLGGVDEIPEVVYGWHAEYEPDLVGIGAGIGPLWRTLETRPVLRLALPEDAPAGVNPDVVAGLSSVIAIALLFRQQLIGSLVLVSAREKAFDSVDADLLQRLANHLTLAINNARLYEDIQRMHVSNLKALSSALNAKDYYTLGHAARVSAYMLLLGSELGWPPDVSGQIEEAAYLHDIGKIGISDRVLLKPSGLNPHEWELMRHHPIVSADIIRPLFNDDLVLGVRHHHERWDGRGYPDGLKGEAIPPMARAMCVVDAYDAMSFRRPYRNARCYQECLAELKRCRGTQFDPAMVDAFGRVLRKLAARRAEAVKVAEQAAARLDLEKHARLVGPADEARVEYAEIAALLREVRDASPPTRYIETMGHVDGKFVMVVDSDEDPSSHVALGEEIYADQELPEAFAGIRVDCNAVVVDQFGAWVSGRVPVVGPDGVVAAVVAADLPPTDEIDLEGLHSDVIESFAGLVKRTVTQGARSELEAITDGLTGLYNVRYLHERLAEEIDRARESETPVALLLCDVDDFRKFNEKHGYDEGDRALRAIALIVEDCLRGVDLAARYGSDEFAAILIGTDATGAGEVAERLRAAIADAHFTVHRDRLTASVGYACYPTDAEAREQLVDKAEWARRRAKRRGRDIVVGFSQPGSGGRPRRR